MLSMGQVLSKYRGLGPGFDFLRIALAVSIVGFHAFELSGNMWIMETPAWYLEYALVPMFFALSGFLVTGSAQRLSLGNFLINRGLRIIPALSVDVVICAFIIGPIVTTYALGSYFSDERFFKYLLNISGYIHYYLPGVFEHHFDSKVNGALWTVPYEVACYFLMSIFIITKWVQQPRYIIVATVIFMLVGLAVEYEYLAASHPGYALRALNFFVRIRGAQLIAAFLMGIALYQLRDRIPYSWPLFFVCCGICIVAMFTMQTADIDRVENRFIFVPPLVYITAFLGLTRIPLPKFFHSGDYSYGVYLYHDPFLQIIISLVPLSVALKGYGALILYAIGLPAVFLVAWASWHYVEKPILGLRKKFSFVAKVRGLDQSSTVRDARPLAAAAYRPPT